MRLLATGDSIVNRHVSRLADPDFAELRDLIRSADAAFTNFEAVTPRRPVVPSPAHGLPVSAPAFAIDELVALGFNLFNLANNHGAAYGWQGFADTLAEFESRKLVAAGGGRTLSEARAPAYLDLAPGRVALIGATATNAAAVLAADAGRGTAARPGVNPLRFHVEYQLDAERFRQLADIDEAIGTAGARRARDAFGPLVHDPGTVTDDSIRLLGGTFVRSAEAGVRGRLHPGDIAALERSIREARRQADVVLVSIHCHEGRGGGWNVDQPADFLVEAARRCVEAGADVIAAHGPHRLRGLELYRGKPILYSLGNFFLQLETVDPVPPEVMAEVGLPPDGTSADYHDHGWLGPSGTPIGFAADPVWFESVVAECEIVGSAVQAVRLHPVELGFKQPRAGRGAPRLVGADRGTAILRRFAELSTAFGTHIEISTAGNRAIATCHVAT